MTLGLTTTVERTKRKLERVNAQAVSTFDLFLLELKSDLVASSASLATTTDKNAVLRSMLSRNPSFLDVFLVSPTGEVNLQQSRVGRSQLSQVSLSDIPSNLAVNEVYISDVQFDRQSPYIKMAIPVTDDIGLPVADLLVVVELNELWNETINVQVGDGGYAYIVEEDGQIIAFRNRRYQEAGVLLQEIIGRSPLDIARSGLNIHRGLGGKWVLAFAQRLEVVPWLTVVEQPIEEFVVVFVVVGAVWLVVVGTAIALVSNTLHFTGHRILLPLRQLQEAVQKLSSGKWNYQIRITHKDELGQLALSFQDMAHRLRDSFVNLEQSNQKMQILNDALIQSESKLTQFLEAVPVGVFVVDRTGKPYYANKRAEQLLGQGVVQSVSAENFMTVYRTYLAGTDQLYPADRQPILRALQGESSHHDDLEVVQGEQRIPLEIWGTPIYDGEGEISYAIAALQDISDRKQAEAERQRFTEQLRQLNIAYQRFVPEEFLDLLEKPSIVEVQLGDAVEKDMAVLFADIRNFTTLSEQMTPKDNFCFINAYLCRMEPAIEQHHGFIDKFIGDAIMALFPGGADDAVQAAISMLQRLTEYNQTRQRPGRPAIQIGIGINTGAVMLGTVGGKERRSSTVISDTVNLAFRLEQLTKQYQTSLLISHQTFLKLDFPHQYDIRLIDNVRVKGKTEQVSIFEVFDTDPDPLRKSKRQNRTKFEQALLFYQLKQYPEAAQLFTTYLQNNPFDIIAEIYYNRCQNYINPRGYNVQEGHED
ncbi:adenylate/guanylate cyclase domain-containing protein [Spirulina sp. CS-785/01]|uniref:adenylate/guanylate cyclase domain-containing protein n=1 Tax=Spirulina sp. CS-785/01 TaxID=3021716 RepID=UPI00232A93D1|nr:adenylate/guanylate cyclase domain-containing protein [Spirulina sp. CS-785/01]MDB9315087.1 adenylate/guanylate cyclase domain-containing protein [Spirulina sp. CS-785/01]